MKSFTPSKAIENWAYTLHSEPLALAFPVKQLRTAKYKKFTPIAKWTAGHFSTTTTLTRASLKTNQLAAKVIGENGVRQLSSNKTPAWLPETPQSNSHQLEQSLELLVK